VRVSEDMLCNVLVAHGSKESILRHVVAEIEDGFYTFTMCNPPFFASDEETDSVSKGRYSAEDKPLRPPPSAAKTGQKTELIAEGGELEFIRKMIRESVQFPLKVK
jgi:23S rRNA A1618 N6-methylase RlmF